jgi:hypothetical protein
MAAMSVATRSASVALDFFIGNGFYFKNMSHIWRHIDSTSRLHKRDIYGVISL